MHYVCKLSVDNLADSTKFPEEWLFKHRWGKGRKDSSTTLPNGNKFVFLTVGGRTSCVVPSVQKKTGPVAGDVKKEVVEHADLERDGVKTKKTKKFKKVAQQTEHGKDESPAESNKGRKRGAKQEEDASPAVNGNEVSDDIDEKPATKKRKPTRKSQADDAETKSTGKSINGFKPELEAKATGRRRSARVSGKGL